MSNIEPVSGYEVANIGVRPYNIDPLRVEGLLEGIDPDRRAIFMIKPGFYPSHPRTGIPIQRYAEGMVTAAGLDVLCTAETGLQSLEVCELYRDVLPPNPEDDAAYGTGWKRALIQYMSARPVFSYLLVGDQAFSKAHRIKDYVRKLNTIAGDETSKVVENFGHVPDQKDFDISLKILFLGGLTIPALSDYE